MRNNTLKRLPIGIQTYEKLVEQDCLYIDKTEYIYKMINYSSFVFLSRPRRFGKSLLVSTIQSYFEGKSDLFKGLYIDSVEKDWIDYPVLKFSMASAKHCSVEQLNCFLGNLLEREEKQWGIDKHKVYANERLTDLILTAHEKTGKKVVVLIDEYDAPLLDVAYDDTMVSNMRQVMRNFYSPLKDCDPYLKFVFITGITKFSQMSIFSELNNLKNISMLPEFASICGITEEEVVTQMADYVDVFAEANGIKPEEAISQLRGHYDGYHFTWPSPDIFNPFSLFNALQDKRMKSYWFESGSATFLIDKLKFFNVAPSMLKARKVLESAFDVPTENIISIIPILYQSGYYTIKDYDSLTGLYVLDIPNNEIRIGLMENLLPNYVNTDAYMGLTTVAEMYMAMAKDDIDEMLRLLQEYLLTIPHCDNTNYEGHYQQLLYVIFSLFCRYVDVEVRTAKGRVDMVVKTAKKIYLFELKLNKSAEVAMAQIDLKKYPDRFAGSGLPIVKIAVNFDSETRTIKDWIIN